MKHKKLFIWSIIIILVAGGGWYYFSSKKTVPTIVTEDVKKTDIIQTVSVTGEVKSKEEVELSFKLSGRAEFVGVSVGDYVEKGQLVAKIDQGVLNEQLREADADIKYQREIYNNMKRDEKTYKKDQRDAQKANIEKAVASRDAIVKQIDETSIYSPIAGVVAKKNIEVGESVTANAAVVVVASDNRTLIVESNIPESDIVKIKLGQKADLIFDSIGSDEKFEAEVYEIEPSSTVIQDVVYYKVRFNLEKFDERLKPGMSADIDVHIAEKKDVLAVPERAIKKESGKKTVQVLNIDGITTKEIEVKTGLKGDDGMVEIISGLSEGEKVVMMVK